MKGDRSDTRALVNAREKKKVKVVARKRERMRVDEMPIA